MTVSLYPMSQIDFDQYMEQSAKGYADEKVKAGTWTKEEAPNKAEEAFQQLLPEGLESKNQHLFAILDKNSKKKVGYLWYNFDPDSSQKEAFIYDFLVFDQFQGQGYGKAALSALDDNARKHGIEKISLHVFSHNKRAIHLYEKLNYQSTDIMMSKWLK